MKKDRHFETAKKYNILKQVENLEQGLLKIPGVAEVEFDLDGFYDDMNQVICLIKYEITANPIDEYFKLRQELKTSVLDIAKLYGLTKTEDLIDIK